MKIIIQSRTQVEWAIYNKQQLPIQPWALISVHTPGDAPVLTDRTKETLVLHMHCIETLSLSFHDIERITKDCVIFSQEDARRILDFADEISSLPLLVIHCDAGISRSAGIGLFLTRYWGMDEGEFGKDNPMIFPNRLVMKRLREEQEHRRDGN